MQAAAAAMAIILINLRKLLIVTACLAASASAAGAVHVHADGHANIHVYVQRVLAGPNATEFQVAYGTGPKVPGMSGVQVGYLYVFDYELTAGPSPTSAFVGRAQGFYVYEALSEPAALLSLNMVFKDGSYSGSTLSVTGRFLFSSSENELSVVGGTGAFRNARGYLILKTYSFSFPNQVFELNAYVVKE